MSDKFHEINGEKYYCNYCDTKCLRPSEWERHILTRKHKKSCNTDANTDNTDMSTSDCDNSIGRTYKCSCGKQYKHRQSLFNHKKQCSYKQINVEEEQEDKEKEDLLEESIKAMLQPLKEKLQAIETNNNSNNSNNNNDISLISEIIKQNQEFQKEIFQQMMEFMKNTNNTITTNSHNTNNNYTQFNLQVYLNETCKNAMNVDEFIEYLQPTLQELEDTARLGYVEGITRIILRGLKDLEETERPFHCSDLKRETMFVKNNNDIWEKEQDEKPQLMKVVKAISRKNFCNVNAWQKEHPTWRNCDSKQNDQYNKILVNSTSGSTEKEQQANYEKIIKNIAKETVINKNKKNSK